MPKSTVVDMQLSVVQSAGPHHSTLINNTCADMWLLANCEESWRMRGRVRTLLIKLQQRVFEVLHVHAAARQLLPRRRPLHIPQRLLLQCQSIFRWKFEDMKGVGCRELHQVELCTAACPC
jgi:hypothetical protein